MSLFQGQPRRYSLEECREILRYATDGGKVHKVMHELKHHELHSGSKSGPLVTDRKQGIAIALSEARKAGEDVPAKNAANDGESYSLFEGQPHRNAAISSLVIRYDFVEHQHPRARDGTFMERGSGRDRGGKSKSKTSTLRGSFPGDKDGPEAKLMDAPATPATAPAAPPSPPAMTKPPKSGFQERRAKLQDRAAKREAEFSAMTEDEKKAHKAERDAKAAVHNARKAGAAPGILQQLIDAWTGTQKNLKAVQKAAKASGKAAKPSTGGKATQLQPEGDKPDGNPFAGFHEAVMQDRLEDVRAGRHLRHQAEGQPVRYAAPLFTGNRLTMEECERLVRCVAP